ncbi:fatty-acid amide hydrolase 2 [Trichonephila clavipes]|nr:fatty-acid amide hydrolase 2 [Trichonephila clavipes]
MFPAIEKRRSKGTDDPTILLHIMAIEQCFPTLFVPCPTLTFLKCHPLQVVIAPYLEKPSLHLLDLDWKEIRSSDVVKSYISRIQAVQPLINAYVDERFQEAFEEAKQVDALISSGTRTVEEMEKETPFLGVPFSAKEAVSVQDSNDDIRLSGSDSKEKTDIIDNIFQ